MIGFAILNFVLSVLNGYVALQSGSLLNAAVSGLCFGAGLSLLIFN